MPAPIAIRCTVSRALRDRRDAVDAARTACGVPARAWYIAANPVCDTPEAQVQGGLR